MKQDEGGGCDRSKRGFLTKGGGLLSLCRFLSLKTKLFVCENLKKGSLLNESNVSI